ncbi:adenosine kinase [Acidocella aminolytica]|uniref:Sugar kinase PfkB n=1 Tax=Acidocella aminolytica 101 = DSM 11237 TaxID=1120923 RepID=A0A0D6PE19_9PROT|nr:adenosine kinase [Acidocella aminolytica]GAN80010.1 sugar kinase PfkB [Acidocella aminolytica 101 = DSM 11237]GBQ40532.1 sugar kinase [Acidocella aminolytica 101 = DSM 11237]SHF08753.1 fructokinase [Acidocella aminolytica 101 = DSM 11237]
MAISQFDITGIGNAIVDFLLQTNDEFLSRHDMPKGAMSLIDVDTATKLTGAMQGALTASGGSVANSCAVAAALGAKVAFLGKVAKDEMGEAFRREIASVGVHYTTPPLDAPIPTARCLILVTPDGQRTMNTYLGACGEFALHDLDETVIAASKVTYLEGYLFDPPAAQAAFIEAARMARAAGQQTALSLSDAFCVDRHRDGFRRLIAEGVDILFANEAEICSLYQVNSFAEAAAKAALDVNIAVLTRSEAGSLILQGGQAVSIPAAPVRVLDTTGAGDAYAAGFLAAYTRGEGLEAAGKLGAKAAALAIARIGARPPATELAELTA